MEDYFSGEGQFDNFVVGDANKLAVSSAIKPIEIQLNKRNLLVIYGECGVGKTHFSHAIANLMMEIKVGSKICYRHALSFVDDVVNTVKTRRYAEFKQHYHALNMLVIDDIQLIADRPASQQELICAIDNILEAHGRVVITSNTLPKDMVSLGISERLVSRISGGLLLTLDRPDLEMRIAILKQKSKSEGISLNDDVASFIAGNFQSNVRELEGALNRLSAYGRFHNLPLSFNTARKALLDLLVRIEVPE